MNKESVIPRIKLIALLVLAALIIVMILQNTQAVATRLLFVAVSMPLAALLSITLLIGFAVGVIVALHVGRRRKKDRIAAA